MRQVWLKLADRRFSNKPRQPWRRYLRRDMPDIRFNNMAAALYLKVNLRWFFGLISHIYPFLRQKQKATGLWRTHNYVTSVRFYSVAEENIQVKARVFRSQRKTESKYRTKSA